MSNTQWRVLGASVVGVSHTAHGTPCQDAHAYRILSGGVLAVAVADGAGSAPRSDEGAQAAVEAALDALERIALDEGPERLFASSARATLSFVDGSDSDVETSIDSGSDTDPDPDSDSDRRSEHESSEASASSVDMTEVISFDGPSTPIDDVSLGAFDPRRSASHEPGDAAFEGTQADSEERVPPSAALDAPAVPSAMRKAFANAIAAVEALAAESATRSRDFACTLTCVLADDTQVVVGQVGDCVAVAKETRGAWTTVGMPQKEGEYANEAYFITQADSFDRLEVESFEIEAEAIVLSTDGLLRLMLQLPAMAPHPPFLDPMVRFAMRTSVPAPLKAFLDSERVNARTDDDKTLVIAYRQPSAVDASSPASDE